MCSVDADAGVRILQRILHWTDGHPYLTQKLCLDTSAAGIDALEDVDNYIKKTFANLNGVISDKLSPATVVRTGHSDFDPGNHGSAGPRIS